MPSPIMKPEEIKKKIAENQNALRKVNEAKGKFAAAGQALSAIKQQASATKSLMKDVDD